MKQNKKFGLLFVRDLIKRNPFPLTLGFRQMPCFHTLYDTHNKVTTFMWLLLLNYVMYFCQVFLDQTAENH